MPTTIRVCTVLNHVDEREAFWTVVEVPQKTTAMRYPAMTVGVGDTEAAAIADFKRRTGLGEDQVEVVISHRDNVNVEIHDGEDKA